MVAPSLLLCFLLYLSGPTAAQQQAASYGSAAPIPHRNDQPQDHSHFQHPHHPTDQKHQLQTDELSSLSAVSFKAASTSSSHAHASSPGFNRLLEADLLQDHDASDMLTLAKPFIASDAHVRSPVSAELQAKLERLEAEDHSDRTRSPRPAGAFRALLHGTARAKKYPRCGRCRMVRCGMRDGRAYCSGHCRRRRKLFYCDTFRVAAAACIVDPDLTLEDVKRRPSSSMREYETVVVTAEAPYIGCADIANRPTGCPARGTPVNLPGRTNMQVVASFCRKEYYLPGCDSPLFPFGMCECVYRMAFRRGRFGRSRRVVRGPCMTTQLPAGSGVGGVDESPSSDDIVVVPSDAVTQTWFSNFTEPGQRPRYTYDVTASVGLVDANVSLSFFPQQVELVNILQAGSEISEDYQEDYEADPEEEEVLDYVADLLPQNYYDRYFDYDPTESGEGVAAGEGAEATA